MREVVIHSIVASCALISIFVTAGIVLIIGSQSVLFFSDPAVTLSSFLFSREWQPTIGKFGILPLLTATFTTSLIAMAVAIPLGLCVAIFLSEYASERLRSIVKPILEVLAGIPTVVYGYFAVTVATPFLQSIIGKDIVEFYNTAAAGLTMGVLILPMVSSMSEDALSAVSGSLREGAYALGATKFQTSLRIVTPAALSGIIAAIIIALSRAIGETMIVALAAGAGPNLTLNPFEAAETLTGYIVRISGGDVSYNSPDYNSIFALGLVLFIITLGLNIISRSVAATFRGLRE